MKKRNNKVKNGLSSKVESPPKEVNTPSENEASENEDITSSPPSEDEYEEDSTPSPPPPSPLNLDMDVLCQAAKFAYKRDFGTSN